MGLEHDAFLAILDALLKLRQACCDPRLLPAGRDRAVSKTAIKAVGSAKLSFVRLGRARESTAISAEDLQGLLTVAGGP